MLEAGLTMLREEPADQLFQRLQAQGISSRAGVTTGSFYHHFAGQDGYIEALLEYVLAKDPNPPFAVAVKVFEEQLGGGRPFLDCLTASCVSLMEWQQTNPTFALQLGVWAKSHRDPMIARRLDRMYRMVEEEMAGYYQAVLNLLGREMRPPFVIADLTGTVIAIFEGLSIRRSVRPGRMPAQRLASVIVPLLLLMTRSSGDSDEAGAWLESNAPRWAVTDVRPPDQPSSDGG